MSPGKEEGLDRHEGLDPHEAAASPAPVREAAAGASGLLVLLSNDDGVYAPGLAALQEAMRPLADVWVVAPDREQSASSHSLTLHRPLRLQRLDEKRVAVDGTPTDSVLVAVNMIVPRQPDLVISGVNAGQNMGEDVTYSGTVAAAMEGAVLGIPSVAVSLAIADRDGAPHYDTAAAVIAELVPRLQRWPLPPGSLLNVNVPDLPRAELRGLRVTKLGTRVYRDVVVKKIDPRGRPYYWIAGAPEFQAGPGTDWNAVRDGYVSLTPIHLDLTDYRSLEVMRAWERAGAEADARR